MSREARDARLREQEARDYLQGRYDMPDMQATISLQEWLALKSERDQLARRVEALERDAARYYRERNEARALLSFVDSNARAAAEKEYDAAPLFRRS